MVGNELKPTDAPLRLGQYLSSSFGSSPGLVGKSQDGEGEGDGDDTVAAAHLMMGPSARGTGRVITGSFDSSEMLWEAGGFGKKLKTDIIDITQRKTSWKHLPYDIPTKDSPPVTTATMSVKKGQLIVETTYAMAIGTYTRVTYRSPAPRGWWETLKFWKGKDMAIEEASLKVSLEEGARIETPEGKVLFRVPLAAVEKP